MALFENFPYTNLHELNLDWLISEMKALEEKVQDGPVISVNGLTGEVVLYQQAYIQLPDISDPNITNWNIFRYLNGHIYGIQFDSNGNVYQIADHVRTKLLTWNDIPQDSGVISINGMYGVVTIDGSDIKRSGDDIETVKDALDNLDDDINSINSILTIVQTFNTAIRSALAYVEPTNTAQHNITAGKYVLWKDGAYKATTNISIGNTLSSTNLLSITTGFLNDIQSSIASLTSLVNNIPIIRHVTFQMETSSSDIRLDNKNIGVTTQNFIRAIVTNVNSIDVLPYTYAGHIYVEFYNKDTAVPTAGIYNIDILYYE